MNTLMYLSLSSVNISKECSGLQRLSESPINKTLVAFLPINGEIGDLQFNVQGLFSGFCEKYACENLKLAQI